MTDVTLRSFDIFDTLVARWCVDPHNIFRAVEAKSAHRDFADMRVRAEAALYAQGEYDLDAIYRAMAASFGLSAVAASHLRALELEEEFDNLVPIREHLAEVRPGDLLISDMYLPKPFVGRVVREICGLHFNPIYLSSHGKTSGRAWETLSRRLNITEHVGDNVHADIEMCRRFGISARRTTLSQPTPAEAMIGELGFVELAQAVRAARLGLLAPDAGARALGQAQIGANFPLLFLSALLLIEFATRKGWKHLLFSSRDCFMLFRLFQRLAARLGVDIAATYFFTSRLSRATPSASYLRYFNGLCADQPTAVVDICGTGWSLTRLFEAAGRPDTDMFLLNIVVNPGLAAAYRAIGDVAREPRAHFITRGGNSDALEALNATDHRMVADVVEVDGVFIPTFVDIAAADRYNELVGFSYEAFQLALQASDKIDANTLYRWISIVRSSHVEQIYAAMNGLSDAVREIAAQQIAENAPVTALLKQRAAPTADSNVP
jgi:hypothetical protein